MDLPIQCACGSVSGVVKGIRPSKANHGICYCNDCQAFAHFLGDPPTFLDANAGTHIVQVSPRRLHLRSGLDHIACVRLKAGGLMRWYASCCNTPLANTPHPRLPILGMITACLNHSVTGQPLEVFAGECTGRVFVDGARGDTSDIPKRFQAPIGMIYRFAKMMVLGLLRGAGRRSPFFHPVTREPIAEPRILTSEELSEITSRRDAYQPG
ncbi:MAG: DUF6151 family protein [Pseudomonadaceae bacterium]|nr:DUF6151 family protein [Pseudomonadaceae bacterium]